MYYVRLGNHSRSNALELFIYKPVLVSFFNIRSTIIIHKMGGCPSTVRRHIDRKLACFNKM